MAHPPAHHSRDRALVWRTTGGKHRYLTGDAQTIVPDIPGGGRLRGVPCSLDGIPDLARLPAGWDTVRDIGAWQVVDVDRNIAALNAQFRVAQAARAAR